jgi:hypothetical protein
MSRRKTTEQFITEAIAKHGNKYGYEETVYEKWDKKVKIWCNACGVFFWQRPHDHLNSSGCRECGNKSMRNKLTKTLEQWVKEAIAVHGARYEYSDVEYKHSFEKVKIYCFGCSKHFWQAAHHHLEGRGCMECYGTPLKTLEKFIDDAIEMHGDRYDYSKSEYINNKSRIEIICLRCNLPFWQIAGDHIRGQGCPKCNLQGYSIAAIRWLETLRSIYPDIQHAETKEKEFRIPETPYRADGYSKSTKTILEYMGCYFHGCKYCYPNRDKLNARKKEIMEVLYQKTKERIQEIRCLGYIVIIQWGCEAIDNLDD